MMKGKFSTKWIVIAGVAFIVIAIALVNVAKQKRIKEEIIQGYSTIMDARLDGFLESTELSYFDFAPNEYANKLGLKKIDYEVVNIKKEDDVYILSIDIYLTCENENEENERLLLAHDVKYEFYELQYDDFEIGGYKCSYYSMKDLDYMNEELITVYLNGEKLLYPQRRGHDSDKNESKSITCRHVGCGKNAKYQEWNRRFCSEHLQGTRTCRYPLCETQIPNSSLYEHCDKHR